MQQVCGAISSGSSRTQLRSPGKQRQHQQWFSASDAATFKEVEVGCKDHEKVENHYLTQALLLPFEIKPSLNPTMYLLRVFHIVLNENCANLNVHKH